MASISCLPSELIIVIFDKLPYPDIIRFGGTCRRFNEMVKSQQMRWKLLYREKVHPDIVKQKTDITDWLQVLRKSMTFNKKMVQYLDEMCSVHYNNPESLDKDDCRRFILLALADDFSLGESIYILQEFISCGYDYLNAYDTIKPYSLTTVFYAKTVLRHLFQAYLALVWRKKHMRYKQPPVYVINFFVQWLDPLNIHSQTKVKAHLEILVSLVKKEILERYPWKVEHDPNLDNRQTILSLSDDEVVNAISTVLYRQDNVNLTPYPSLSALDIVKVIQNRCGGVVAMGAIYQYLGKRFGLQCDLIVLPNHFILEVDRRDDKDREYKIDFETGEYTDNAYILQGMLKRLREERSQSVNSLKHLEDKDPSLMEYNVNYFKMQPEQLSFLKKYSLVENPLSFVCRKRSVIVKTRRSDLKYAVGMICYHRKYNYIGLIIEWHTTSMVNCVHPAEITNLEFGIKQPYYHVMAMDHTERYVPQENIEDYSRPKRLFHLEDAIAPHFSHFNGFAYVPNDEKAKEYPDDTAVSDFFKSQYDLQNRVF